MNRLKRDESARVPTVVMVIAVIGILLVSAIFAVGYANRADDYANDPQDPPDEVERTDTDGDGDVDEKDDPPDPKWIGRFMFSVEFETSGSDRVDIYQANMGSLESWNGEPWSAASLFPAAWGWSDSYDVKYVLKLSKGSSEYMDKGEFEVYKDDDYQEVGHRSKLFFFWKEQVGLWYWDLKVTIDGNSKVVKGNFQITTGGRINQQPLGG